MSIKGMPFDYDAQSADPTLLEYSAQYARQFIKSELTNGIYPKNFLQGETVSNAIGTSFKVTKGAGLTLNISAGGAVIEGLRITSDTDTTLTLPQATDATIYDIVLRVDFTNQVVTTDYKIRRIDTSNARCLNMTRTASIYEICLASVTAKDAIISVVDTRLITDRCSDNKALCGIVSSIYQTDTASIIQLMNDYIELLNNEVVGTSRLADGAVTTEKIASEAVTDMKIGTGAVTGSKIATGAVNTQHLAENAVTTEKISSRAITTEKLGIKQVKMDNIDDNAIQARHIQNNAIVADKIMPGEIYFHHLSDAILGAISSGNVADGGVTTVKIKDSAVTGVKIAKNTILGGINGNIAEKTVDGYNIKDNAITENKIDSGAVTTDKIGNEAITNMKIATGAVISSKIATGAINTQHLAENAVTTNAIANLSVITGKLASGAVTETKIDSTYRNTLATKEYVDNAINTAITAVLGGSY